MSRQLPLKHPPKSLCVLRLSALGDVTHAIPLIRQIKIQWPECEITWVCGSFEHKFLRLIEGVKFIVFDKKKGISAYRQLRKDLRGTKFDVLLHMQVSARANLASLFIRSDVRVGWDKTRSRDGHHLFVNKSVPDAQQQHQQDGFLSFGHTLGLPEATPHWDLPITDNARSFIDQHIDQHIESKKPLLVISPCSSHKLRNWSAERYAAVADYAVQTHGMLPVLTGGPSDYELEMSNAILENMTCSALNLVGKDTLEQLIGLLDRADIVLSPDSGPAHLANAVGAKVIGLYACTWSKRSGPYHCLDYCVDKFEEAAVLHTGKKAQDLFWGTKIEKPGVMDMITVDEVCEKLDLAMSEQ